MRPITPIAYLTVVKKAPGAPLQFGGMRVRVCPFYYCVSQGCEEILARRTSVLSAKLN